MAIPVGAIIAAIIGFLVIVGVGVGLYMIAPTARSGLGDGELPAGMGGAAVGAPDETEAGGIVGDTTSPASDADNTNITEEQIVNSVSVETPDNYEFMFDDCPKGLSSSVISTNMTITSCADECTKRENCGAFLITGCTTSKNCGGQCTLLTNNTTNIISKSEFGNGLCSTTVGDMKLYRKKA
ncbi:putative membrane protein [Emiliania huxleyi virus 99B1]|nr:hypothetical protein EhVM1_000241 [Emiliania huxleyi virus M1]CAZ69560.1 putative membrane protein [Emiliania huxleyi virus 99B1]|mmetsp:Transcript_23718/g.68017  ORF Transcript_23718/g.68017 Transcript_23718/m.68017 type:complete len:183 (-) Transcript_23718:1410-1958(-)